VIVVVVVAFRRCWWYGSLTRGFFHSFPKLSLFLNCSITWLPNFLYFSSSPSIKFSNWARIMWFFCLLQNRKIIGFSFEGNYSLTVGKFKIEKKKPKIQHERAVRTDFKKRLNSLRSENRFGGSQTIFFDSNSLRVSLLPRIRKIRISTSVEPGATLMNWCWCARVKISFYTRTMWRQ
jgi:hypothetical protein